MKPDGPIWLGDLDNRESTKVYPSQNQNTLSIFFRQLSLLSSLFSVSSQTRNGRSLLPLHCSFLHQHNQSSTSHYTLFFFFSSLCEFPTISHSFLSCPNNYVLILKWCLIYSGYDKMLQDWPSSFRRKFSFPPPWCSQTHRHCHGNGTLTLYSKSNYLQLWSKWDIVMYNLHVNIWWVFGSDDLSC